MKVGQLLSTDPDIIDSGFAERLATLQRTAPPMDYMTLVNQFESALDTTMNDAFSFFDPEPLGSASIGQVHRARLHDGREVAVKIQYPGIAQSIDSDMNHLRRMLRLGRVFMSRERADAFVEEARQSITAEADYGLEAKNLQDFRKLFADWPDIRIPEPILEFSTSTVLTMEFIDGVPFDTAVLAIEDETEKTDSAGVSSTRSCTWCTIFTSSTRTHIQVTSSSMMPVVSPSLISAACVHSGQN